MAFDNTEIHQFFHSVRAFDVLERLDPSPEYWQGKCGVCVGVLQMVIAGQKPKDSLQERILRGSSQPQAELIILTMKNWTRENRASVPGL